MAGSKFKLLTAMGFAPEKHSVPEGGADALAADGLVGNEIFEIGIFSDAGAHGDRHGGDTDDFAVIVDGHEEVVPRRGNDVVEPFPRDFAFVFAATGELNEELADAISGFFVVFF